VLTSQQTLSIKVMTAPLTLASADLVASRGRDTGCGRLHIALVASMDLLISSCTTVLGQYGATAGCLPGNGPAEVRQFARMSMDIENWLAQCREPSCPARPVAPSPAGIQDERCTVPARRRATDVIIAPSRIRCVATTAAVSGTLGSPISAHCFSKVT
jgi:hypothetical protein